MEKGKKLLLEGLDDLTPESMAEEIPFFGGKRKRDAALMLFVSEILHHEGQLATAMGTIKRQRERE